MLGTQTHQINISCRFQSPKLFQIEGKLHVSPPALLGRVVCWWVAPPRVFIPVLMLCWHNCESSPSILLPSLPPLPIFHPHDPQPVKLHWSSHQNLWQMCQIRCLPTSGICWWVLSPKTTSVTLCHTPSHVDSTFLVSHYSGVHCPVLATNRKKVPS